MLELNRVSVVAAGHSILQDISLTIQPGSHVALWLDDGRLHESKATDGVFDGLTKRAVAGPVVEVMLNGGAKALPRAVDNAADEYVTCRDEIRFRQPVEANR